MCKMYKFDYRVTLVILLEGGTWCLEDYKVSAYDAHVATAEARRKAIQLIPPEMLFHTIVHDIHKLVNVRW